MTRLQKTLWTLLIVATSVLLAQLMQPHFNDTSVAMIYVLAVVATAFLLGFWPAVATCLLGVVLYDFVNLPPYFTFSSNVIDYMFTLITMLVTAVAISNLATSQRRQLRESEERVARTSALFELSEQLARDLTDEDILAVTCGHLARAFPVRVQTGQTGLGKTATARHGLSLARDDRGTITIVLSVNEHARRETWLTLSPLQDWLPTNEEEAHLRAMARIAEQALARAALRENVQDSRAQAQQESLRSSILGAVSHDLRTPLASIIGASSTLLESGGELVDDSRRELRQVIYDEAIHMQRMVENLLDLARIRSGDIRAGMTWQALEEIVGGTLASIRRRNLNRDFVIDVPPDLPLILCDGVLIERVLTNLLDNAAKHAPPPAQIALRARLEQAQLVVEVCDGGPGIPPALRERVFEPFFRAGGKPGSGLGLAICRGIVEAHEGSIVIDGQDAGGCRVTLRLPVPADRPTLERDLYLGGR